MLHPYGEGTEIDVESDGDDTVDTGTVIVTVLPSITVVITVVFDGGDDTDDTGTVTVTVFPSTTVVITVELYGTEGDGLHTSSHGDEGTTSYTISG